MALRKGSETTILPNTVDIGVLKIDGTAFTVTPAELNQLDGVVAGTVTASKAVVVGTNKNIDTISIADGGLKLGSGAGTAVGSTAAELNSRTDDSAMVDSIVAAGAVSTSTAYTAIDSTAGAMAITLAVPTKPAYVKVIKMTVDGGDTTMALTNVVGGSAATTATFGAVGDTLVLVSDDVSGKWVVLKEVGVVLS